MPARPSAAPGTAYDLRIFGGAEPEEVAAITAILLARAAARPISSTPARRPDKAGWRRWERPHGFPAPHSWQQ